MVCPYCGRAEVVPTTAEQVQERSYLDYLRPAADRLGMLTQNALQLGCNSCGATVVFEPSVVAGECSFCGARIVAQPRLADPLVAPEGILPFHIVHEQASDAVKQWLATRWFAPNSLKRLAYQETIGGVYLPFWTYDAHTLSHYRGRRGEYYFEMEQYTTRDSSGRVVTGTRRVRRTRWYAASGAVDQWFDDILIPATLSVDRRRLVALEPWGLDLLQPYDPAYLSGFKAQRYAVNLDKGFDEAKQVMASAIELSIRRAIGGDEQIIDDLATSYSGITFKHLLLPVYVAAYRYNQKAYQVLVNARTGEVQGDRPYSIWKIAMFVILVILLLGIVAYVGGS